MSRGWLYIVLCLSAVGLTSCKWFRSSDASQPVAGQLPDTCQVAEYYEFGLPLHLYEIDTCQVAEGETLGGILNRLGASRAQQNGIIRIPATEFDVRKIRPGQTYYALYRQEVDTLPKQLQYWIYQPSIRETVVLHLTDSIHVEHFEKPIRTERRQAVVTIESSLWNAMAGSGLPTELALELSDIYAWTIDFFGLQKNDSIRVLYDERFVDDASLGVERIHAAHFYHAGKWYTAYYYESGDVHTYFDAEGQSLRKAFLKAPLNYKRISSTFTYNRVHPVYKTVRPHTGVDYAAPAGTPVVSIGDGVVTERCRKGDAGNMVKIKHNSTYTTAYLHLSKFGEGLQVGSHVQQGQVIGYVGSTGASTGPHLDFRVWKNGTPVDPLKMDSPPADPVPADMREDFLARVKEFDSQLLK